MFAGFPVHHMTDNVRVRWIQGRTLLRPRDRKGTAQTQYKYNNFIIRKSKFPQNPKRSVRFSGKRTKRSVQKRKARNTQKAETKVL